MRRTMPNKIAMKSKNPWIITSIIGLTTLGLSMVTGFGTCLDKSRSKILDLYSQVSIPTFTLLRSVCSTNFVMPMRIRIWKVDEARIDWELWNENMNRDGYPEFSNRLSNKYLADTRCLSVFSTSCLGSSYQAIVVVVSSFCVLGWSLSETTNLRLTLCVYWLTRSLQKNARESMTFCVLVQQKLRWPEEYPLASQYLADYTLHETSYRQNSDLVRDVGYSLYWWVVEAWCSAICYSGIHVLIVCNQ